MKAHAKYLKDSSWLENNINLQENIHDKPSYLMTHSLEEDYQLYMYSFTHNTKVDVALYIRKIMQLG